MLDIVTYAASSPFNNIRYCERRGGRKRSEHKIALEDYYIL